MLIRQFPDLQWIRHQSKTNFADQKAEGNVKLPQKGWPSVVLNVRSNGAERNDIIAPFTLFTNIRGKSEVTLDGKKLALNEDTFCLANRGQNYDLVIPEHQSTETFNIHFGDQLYQEVVQTIQKSTNQLLETPDLTGSPDNLIQIASRWTDESLHQKLRKIRAFYAQEPTLDQIDAEYEVLSTFLASLLNNEIDHQIAWTKMEAQKKATRHELIRRIGLAVNFIHDAYTNEIDLDEMCRTAGLSKFHFLRVFKEVYGCSPRQYLIKIRLDKAQRLLVQEDMTISQIAWQLGYCEPASFTRAFRRHFGYSPEAYRKNKRTKVYGILAI